MLVYFNGAKGKSIHKLNAFDKALIKMGIGNANLVKLSSVLPVNAKVVRELPTDIKIGEIIPAVYVDVCVREGKAACGLVIGYRKEGGGLFYEYKGSNKEEVNRMLEEMIKEAFKIREWELTKIEKIVVEVEGNGKEYECGVVIAAFLSSHTPEMPRVKV